MRLFLMIFSRTDLRIGVSRAKNCKESDCDVHFCVAPPKPTKNSKKIAKQVFDVETLNVGNRLKACWQSSEAVRAMFEG